MARPDHRDEWLRIEAQLWGCYHHHCFLTEFRSLGKNFLTISLDKTLGAGSLGVQCLRDADGISWALRASDGLAGAGASTSVWSSLMGEGRREAPLPGHLCLSRAAVSPFMWQPLPSTRAPGEGGGSGPFISGKDYIKAIYYHPAYLTSMQSTSAKYWAGWSTSWNQDCWQKYQ